MERFEEIDRVRLTFGMHVRTLRREQRLTQKQLGSMTGIDRTHISRLESGQGNVSLETILLLANGLGTSPAELLGEIDASTSAFELGGNAY